CFFISRRRPASFATLFPYTTLFRSFGDLEISTLRQIPAGRSGIESFVVPVTKPSWVDRVWHRVREEVDQGKRAYVVCSRIGDVDNEEDTENTGPVPELPVGESGRQEPTSVIELVEKLREHSALEGVDAGMVPRPMAAEEEAAALQRFVSGRWPVLVSSTVIDVGVDVPEATVMVIMDADRLGVSQLHHLRGRVGRGKDAGLCLLVTTAEPDTETGQRLAKRSEERRVGKECKVV